MSAIQIAVRSQGFKGFSFARAYGRFLDWWVGLYAEVPERKFRAHL